MTRKDIPNIISILRIMLTVPIIALLVKERFGEALLLFAVAGASDALDGYLAKRNGWESRLGSILDPVADKLLLVSSFITLGWLGIIPMWLVYVVLGRDIIILTGAIAYHLLIGNYDMRPTIVSKINTFSQIVLVLAIVFSFSLITLPEWFLTRLIDVVLATTVLSGVDYVWTWGKIALKEHRTTNRKTSRKTPHD